MYNYCEQSVNYMPLVYLNLFLILSIYRRTLPTYLCLRAGKTIAYFYQRTWQRSTAYFQSAGSRKCGVQIRFLRMPNVSPSKKWQYQTTIYGYIGIKLFCIWSSMFYNHFVSLFLHLLFFVIGTRYFSKHYGFIQCI